MKEVAAGATLTGVLFIVSVFFPVFGFIAALFIPLPVLYYRLKLGRTAGAWIPIATGIFMIFVLGDEIFSILFFFELLVLGFLLGEALAAGYGLEWIFAIPAAVLFAMGILVVAVTARSAGMNIGSWLSAYVEQNLKLTLSLYESLGVTESSIRLLSEQLDKIRMVLVRILPGVAVSSVLFTIWVNLLAARRILSIKQVMLPVFDGLNRWRAPDVLVWGVIASGTGLMIPSGFVKILCLNAFMVLLCVYFFQGMAIIAFFFEKKKLPRGFRTILYMLIVLQQVLLLVVIGLGFFDVWVNFRKLGNDEGAG